MAFSLKRLLFKSPIKNLTGPLKNARDVLRGDFKKVAKRSAPKKNTLRRGLGFR